MTKPHKHAALIKAWGDGAEIEFWNEDRKSWLRTKNPLWGDAVAYRIKPTETGDTQMSAETPSNNDTAEHPHIAVFREYLKGKTVQVKRSDGRWDDCRFPPSWTHDAEYRVKPEDVVVYAWLPLRGSSAKIPSNPSVLTVMNLKITYDGETGEPKAVELIKGDKK